MTLAEVVAEFEPVGLTPWDAADQCYNESWRFRLCLEQAGVDATLVSGFRFDMVCPHYGGCGDPECDAAYPVVTQGHTAVLVGGEVYDWTARQFDADAPVPLVQPYAEWREEWRNLTL